MEPTSQTHTTTDRTAMDAPAPRFSVVIPLYNRAHIITPTLKSVLDQDFEDFEIVIVDDGSTDNPAEVINAIGDPRIALIHQANGGGGAARTRGILEARGDYIAFLDSDDFFLPGKLSTMAEVVNNDGITVYYSQTLVDRGVGKSWIKPDRGIRPGEDVGEYLFCANQVMQTSTMVVPASLAKTVLFDPDLRRGQDLDFSVRLQSNGAKFQMVEKPLTIWLDASEVGRTSYVKGYELSLFWLQKCGHLLTPKALYGYRATVLAYHMAGVQPFRAGKDLFLGWIKGGVEPVIIMRQALRSYLPRSFYRSVVNMFVSRFGRGKDNDQNRASMT